MTAPVTPSRPSGPAQLRALHRVLLRTQVTRGRLLALGALAGLGVLVGLAVGAADDIDRVEAGIRLASGFGLAVLAPVVTLVFASAVLGDLVEDTTLVHVWLRPVPRHLITAAAVLAALTVAGPMVVVPLVVAVALTGAGSQVVVATAAAATLAVASYTTVFCALGLRARRALVWGLLYIAIWEGFVAGAGGGAARIAIRTHTRSLLARLADQPADAEVAMLTALIIPLGALVAALPYTTFRLRRMDVP